MHLTKSQLVEHAIIPAVIIPHYKTTTFFTLIVGVVLYGFIVTCVQLLQSPPREGSYRSVSRYNLEILMILRQIRAVSLHLSDDRG